VESKTRRAVHSARPGIETKGHGSRWARHFEQGTLPRKQKSSCWKKKQKRGNTKIEKQSKCEGTGGTGNELSNHSETWKCRAGFQAYGSEIRIQFINKIQAALLKDHYRENR